MYSEEYLYRRRSSMFAGPHFEFGCADFWIRYVVTQKPHIYVHKRGVIWYLIIYKYQMFQYEGMLE